LRVVPPEGEKYDEKPMSENGGFGQELFELVFGAAWAWSRPPVAFTVGRRFSMQPCGGRRNHGSINGRALLTEAARFTFRTPPARTPNWEQTSRWVVGEEWKCLETDGDVVSRLAQRPFSGSEARDDS